jgi:hypothetical protein
MVQSSALAHGRCPEQPARQKIGAVAPRRYEAELSALCVPYLRLSEVPQRVFYVRAAKYLAALFDVVEDPAVVPPTNNAAERSVRHLVAARKCCGGTRSTPAFVPDLAGAVAQVGTALPAAGPHPRCSHMDQRNR